MRNLTVRVPNEVYDAARAYAARYHTSISAVVADFLFTLRNLARENQDRENKLVSPGAAVDLHCDRLRENRDIGRANLEPLNDKEFFSVARNILNSMQ
jgi:hypothetical protein